MSGRERLPRVLVIDDDDLVRKVHARSLRGDFDVVALSSAFAALARLMAGERFAAILCDVVMPDLDGVQFLRRVHDLDPALAARIVFVTGGAPEPVARALSALPNRVLEKPVSLRELRDTIRQTIERPGRRA